VLENPKITTAELAPQVDEPFREEVESSWERMFDLDLMRRAFTDPEMTCEGYEQHIQAVFEYFTADEIVKVTRFVSR
jgi:hypothetical protein